ncbi:MAG: PH domain-containing protein [Propionicimonas sp.]
MPQVLRPRTVLITGIVLSAVLVAASALGWMLLPAEIRVLFTVPQLLTLGLFVLVMIAIMIAVGLSTVRIEPGGLRIRNGVRSHWITWAEVRGIRFSPHDAWAFVQLDGDPDTRPLLAVQRSDGPRADRAVAALRAAWRDACPDHPVRERA